MWATCIPAHTPHPASGCPSPTAEAPPAAQSPQCSWRPRPGLLATFYRPLASSTNPADARSHTAQIIAMLQTPRIFAPGWNLAITRHLRAIGRHSDDDGWTYAGPRHDLERLQAVTPGSAVIDAHDTRRGHGSFLVSHTAVPPAELVRDQRQIRLANPRAYGQVAIDLAWSLDAPCLLERPHWRDPALMFLHRSASLTTGMQPPPRTRGAESHVGAWRTTFIERIGPTHHEHTDRSSPDVACLVGRAIQAGFTLFAGNRLDQIDPRLQHLEV